MTSSRKQSLVFLSSILVAAAWGADPPSPSAANPETSDAAAQVALLKTQLAEQKKQIE